MKVLVSNEPGQISEKKYVFTRRWSAQYGMDEIYSAYPFRIGYTSSLLQRDVEGISVDAIDPLQDRMTTEQYLERVRECRPDILIMEVSSMMWVKNMALLKEIKSEFEPTIVVVGNHITAYAPESLEEYRHIDFGVRGEYMETVKELVQSLARNESYEGILGLVWRKGDEVRENNLRPLMDVNCLPWPDRKNIDPLKYYDFCIFWPTIQMLSSFGCPYGCIFCPDVYGMYTYQKTKYRVRHADDVVDEMEYVKIEFGAKQAYFDDDTFTLSKKHVFAICEELLRRKLHMPFTIMADPISVDRQMIEVLSKAGCLGMKFGVESADPRVLENMRGKPVNLEKVRNIVKWCREFGMVSHATFCFGLPGETKESMQRTFDFAKSLGADNAQFSIATPMPGTPFYKYVKENGYLICDDFSKYDGMWNCVFSYPHLTAEEIKSFQHNVREKWSQIEARNRIKLAFQHPRWGYAKVRTMSFGDVVKILKRAIQT